MVERSRTQYETEVRALLEKTPRSTVLTNMRVFDAYKAELRKFSGCNNKFATAAKLFAGISLVFEEKRKKAGTFVLRGGFRHIVPVLCTD